LDIIKGIDDAESDPTQDRDDDYGVGDHYALPLFLVELGELRLQARRQHSHNDNISDYEEEEDQGIADSLKFNPVLQIQAGLTLGEADINHLGNNRCLECHDRYLNEY
jgi:hypothetical protein